MTTERPDDELSARLRDALVGDPLEPDDAAWAALEAALAARGTPVVEPTSGAPRAGRVRRFAGRRATVAAIAAVSALTVSGAAAAAVATNTLPGPLRSLAYNLGLPVTSPGLYQAQQEAAQLRASLHAHRAAQAHSLGLDLATHLKALDPSERSSIEGDAKGLLEEAGVTPPVLAPPSGDTTTTAPTRAGEETGAGPTSSGEDSSAQGSGDATSTTTTTLLSTTTSLAVEIGGGDH